MRDAPIAGYVVKANVASGTAAACRRVVRPLPALERRRRRLQPEPGEAAVHVLKARDGSDAAGDVERDRADRLERVRCALPSGRGDVLAWLRRVGRVVEEYYRDGVVMVTALVPPKVAGQLRKRLPEAAARPC